VAEWFSSSFIHVYIFQIFTMTMYRKVYMCVHTYCPYIVLYMHTYKNKYTDIELSIHAYMYNHMLCIYVTHVTQTCPICMLCALYLFYWCVTWMCHVCVLACTLCIICACNVWM
jgi:hypothetical protein